MQLHSFSPLVHHTSLLGTWLKRHHAFLCLAFVWVYAAFWATMPLIGWGSYAPEPFGTSCTLDWWLAQASVSGQSFVMAILFFCLILPTGIIVFSYVMIIFKVKSSAKEISHFDARIRNSHNLEMKLTKVGERLEGRCGKEKKQGKARVVKKGNTEKTFQLCS